MAAVSGQFGSTAECPSCGSQAEPEQDGDILYFACYDCGFEFGHSITAEEETCAAGFSLAHLATLDGSTSQEKAAYAEFGKTLGPSEQGVFLGSVIPLRSQDN